MGGHTRIHRYGSVPASSENDLAVASQRRSMQYAGGMQVARGSKGVTGRIVDFSGDQAAKRNAMQIGRPAHAAGQQYLSAPQQGRRMPHTVGDHVPRGREEVAACGIEYFSGANGLGGSAREVEVETSHQQPLAVFQDRSRMSQPGMHQVGGARTSRRITGGHGTVDACEAFGHGVIELRRRKSAHGWRAAGRGSRAQTSCEENLAAAKQRGGMTDTSIDHFG